MQKQALTQDSLRHTPRHEHWHRHRHSQKTPDKHGQHRGKYSTTTSKEKTSHTCDGAAHGVQATIMGKIQHNNIKRKDKPHL